jgi:hypothetical protein
MSKHYFVRGYRRAKPFGAWVWAESPEQATATIRQEMKQARLPWIFLGADAAATLGKIRAHYPRPVRWPDPDVRFVIANDQYSIGGAFFMFFGLPFRFPQPVHLVDFLSFYCPALPEDKAKRYAEDIVTLNQEGAFAAAWKTLGTVLRFAGKPEEQ